MKRGKGEERSALMAGKLLCNYFHLVYIFLQWGGCYGF